MLVLALISDEFQHRFRLHLGIDLASIFIFRDSFSNDLLDWILLTFDQTWVQKGSVGNNIFAPFFDPVPHEMFLKIPWFILEFFGSILAPFWHPSAHFFSLQNAFNSILFLLAPFRFVLNNQQELPPTWDLSFPQRPPLPSPKRNLAAGSFAKIYRTKTKNQQCKL